jgi:site-specific DNA recombinase
METYTSAQIGVPKMVLVDKVNYVLYARKSTESEEKQILSIESQVKEMRQIAERDGLEIVDIRREAHSAKASGQRPVFSEILRDIEIGRFTGILTWAPDRLSRNAGDLGALVDLMDEKRLVEIKTFGQGFTNTPSDKFLLMILCSQAKLENDNKSINVKRGLRTRCEMGLWPAPAPTGYLNEKRVDRKGHVYVDSERGHIIRQMFEKVAYEKWSGRKIYHWLKFDLNFKSPHSNKNLTLSNIYLILQNDFYHGTFEYPRKSGLWYKGVHEPLVTKELFDLVQQQTRSQIIRVEDKEFAFTKLITCGLCGSGICADEKFKKLKNGNIHRYVYYGCTKSRDKNCKCGYINEEELIQQFLKLIDEVDINEVGLKEKIKEKVEWIKAFNSNILGTSENFKVADIDIRNYMKFVLLKGQNVEKREILGCLQNQILLKNKIVSIKN